MSKELTPIYDLLTWLGENRTKIENDGFWYVDVSCKMASMLSKESTFIRKKEREAAENSWNESASTMSIESYVNEDDCVGFYDIQIEQSKQKFLNEKYPL
jgi:hypothetical protein